MGAVFDAVGGVVKVAAAAVTQGVERTVAKQAAEGLGVCTGVALSLIHIYKPTGLPHLP